MLRHMFQIRRIDGGDENIYEYMSTLHMHSRLYCERVNNAFLSLTWPAWLDRHTNRKHTIITRVISPSETLILQRSCSDRLSFVRCGFQMIKRSFRLIIATRAKWWEKRNCNKFPDLLLIQRGWSSFFFLTGDQKIKIKSYKKPIIILNHNISSMKNTRRNIRNSDY